MTEDEKLAIEAACIRLQLRYGTLADRHDPRFGELFVPDATITIPEYPPFLGLESILEAQVQWRASGLFMRHVFTNFMIDVKSASHATGICYLTVLSYDSSPSEPLPQSKPPSFGEYHDRFVKVDGSWFFKSRELYRFFRGFAQNA